MKKIFILFMVVTALGCGPLMNLESGRTIGKKMQSIQVNLEAVYFDDKSEVEGVFPIGEIRYNYGLLNKLDIGISATTGGNAQIFTKYQFIGNETSKNAMSVGFKVGQQFQVFKSDQVTRFYVPLYYSYHPTSKFGLFVNPMYIKQVLRNDDNSDFFGVTTGTIFYFDQNELSLGINYNLHTTNNNSDDLYFFGVGYKFKF